MPALSVFQKAHRRKNILTGEWVLVSPQRNLRPWQGKTEAMPQVERPEYDPACYLCPGNHRASGQQMPDYESVFAFDNDFPAILPHISENTYQAGLLEARAEQGYCRVLCFSPNHALTLADMDVHDIERVIALWQQEYGDLGALPNVRHVQIFENKGELMGCSNPHPHGQIWAQASIPSEVLKKSRQQEIYWKTQGKGLLATYLAEECSSGERILFMSDHMVALVPFWAVWPFEVMILPRRQQADITALSEAERKDFAAALQRLLRAYDALFGISFPYSSGIHQAPTDGQEHPEWHWHMSFYPPLLRSATVKKFMVGYEMFGEAQRDISPEQAAERLRACLPSE